MLQTSNHVDEGLTKPFTLLNFCALMNRIDNHIFNKYGSRL